MVPMARYAVGTIFTREDQPGDGCSSSLSGLEALAVAFRIDIAERCTMAFDLKEIVAARLGENYQLHERHVNRTLVAAQRVIGFDKVYARAEGAYLYDMDNQPYLDFLSGYSVFNIGRNHPVVKQAIRDVLDLDLPNMVQMDCSLLSGLLAEGIDNYVHATWPHSSLRPFKAKAVRHPKPISSRARRSFAENMERSWFQTKCRPVLAAPERCSVSSIGIWSLTSLRSRKL